MNQVAEFAEQNQGPSEIPSYTGHVLMLDLTKARKFQTWNFFVGVKHRMDICPEETLKQTIHDAVVAGVLIDISEHPELFIPDKSPIEVSEQPTGSKVYSGTRGFFRDLGIDDDERAPAEDIVAYGTSDLAEQTRIDQALRDLPVTAAAPVSLEEARQRAQRPLIELAPGMNEPERYLLRI
jgi:hypothetical protein